MSVLDAAQFGEYIRRLPASDLYSGDGARFYGSLVEFDRSEIQAYRRLAREAGGFVVDLAAGNGRLSIPLAGVAPVLAIDSSPELVAMLDARAREVGLGPERLTGVVADILAWTPSEPAALAIIGATSIALFSRVQRRELFARIASWHAPDGRLAFSAPVAHGSERLAIVPVALPDSGKVGLLFDIDDPACDQRTSGVLVIDGDGISTYRSEVFKPTASDIEAELLEAGFSIEARIGLDAAGPVHRPAAIYVCGAPR